MNQAQSSQNIQVSPLDVLVNAVYKAQSRGAYNLNESAIIAKAVNHFAEQNTIHPTVLSQVNGDSSPNDLNITSTNHSTSTLTPTSKVEETFPKVEAEHKVTITDEDLTQIRVIGANKKKSNLKMVIEDDSDEE